MMNVKEKLKEIVVALEEYDNARERKNKAVKPMFTDMSLIPKLYSHFCEIMKSRDANTNLQSPTNRKKFLFVALFLFAPDVLAGDRMHYGMRKALKKYVSGDESLVSIDSRPLVFHYMNYTDFRDDTNSVIRTFSNSCSS